MDQAAIQPAPKKRIEYIDALRGFTMILVVFYHVSLMSFHTDSSFVNQLFMSFRMPLFFFISGFIGYKANVVWNRQTWWTMSKKKILIQLLPTFVFGLLYAYAYQHIDFKTFIMDFTKYGFWFTIVLLEMFIMVYALNVLAYNSNSTIFKKRQTTIMILLSVLLFGAKYVLGVIPFVGKLSDLFSLYCLFRYFPYFAFGYICSMNKDRFHRILDSRYFALIIIVLFAICFYINLFLIYPNISNNIVLRISYHVLQVVIGLMGLLIVYNTFRVYQDSFTSNKKAGSALQYIGKRTLDIYLLHWFFLPVLPQLGNVLSEGRNMALELVLGGGLSLIIVGICLVVSSVLRTSPILAKYLFGARK